MDTDVTSHDETPDELVRLDETPPEDTDTDHEIRIDRPGESDEFTDVAFLGSRPVTPDSGWRRLVMDLTRGYINPGLSPRQARQERLYTRVRRPIEGCQRIAVLSRKGGVGKTTVALGLGHTLASLRHDRTVAIDANPDAGTLGYRMATVGGGSITDLVRDGDAIRRYSDAHAYTALAPSRLEVVASDDDPAVTHAVVADDYRQAIAVLDRHYNLVIADTGTDITHSVMHGVLSMANQIVIVVGPSLDGARASAQTLDWLHQNGHRRLATDAVAVINGARGRSLVDLDRIWAHFAGRVRAVETIPWDAQLEAGGVLDLDRLASKTAEAYVRVAAAVMDGFAPGSPPAFEDG